MPHLYGLSKKTTVELCLFFSDKRVPFFVYSILSGSTEKLVPSQGSLGYQHFFIDFHFQK